jgi:aspartate/methionine/tyrosine aminotransferase
MKTVANFDRIGEENAFAVLARATALAAQGRDIINLGIGQPDFRTPEHIRCATAITAIPRPTASCRCARRWPAICTNVTA